MLCFQDLGNRVGTVVCICDDQDTYFLRSHIQEKIGLPHMTSFLVVCHKFSLRKWSESHTPTEYMLYNLLIFLLVYTSSGHYYKQNFTFWIH